MLEQQMELTCREPALKVGSKVDASSLEGGIKYWHSGAIPTLARASKIFLPNSLKTRRK
jgi:hypothetical protein